VHGFKIIFQFCVSILTSIGDSVPNILKKCFAHHLLHVLHAQHLSIFGCLMVGMTFLPWLSVLSTIYGSTHVIVGIFEVHNTNGVAIANQVKVLWDFFDLLDKSLLMSRIKGPIQVP
jgi:hypothetical protein